MAFAAGSIGADLDSIEDAAAALDKSGGDTVDKNTKTDTAGTELVGDITDSMGRLIEKFVGIAGELKEEINVSTTAVHNSTWGGKSKDAADQIKTDLDGEIDRVLGEAQEALGTERDKWVAATEELTGAISEEFSGLTDQIQKSFGDLATAARQTAMNFDEADKTISV